MGTYTHLTIADYPIIDSKSAVIPEVMTIFRESDRRSFRRRVADQNELIWGKSDPDNTDEEDAIDYCCEVSKVLDRLDVMGFTHARIKAEFDEAKQFEIDKYVDWGEIGRRDYGEEIELLKSVSYEDLSSALGRVMRRGLLGYKHEENAKAELDPIERYVLNDREGFAFGFFCNDFRALVRFACESMEPTDLVVQDISELISSGYYEPDESVCSDCIESLVAGHPENAPRIILTEGSTDGAILKAALAFLYPHLADYYTFLNFEASRVPGGASALVATIKAFSAAGITNRMIAIFDNDTASREAQRALDQVTLPDNIAVMHYPELNALNSYPTIGPSGPALANVNTLAGSIELYLGLDVLQDENGDLRPVQWRGYNEALRCYQGEVMGKAEIHSAYRRKVELAGRDATAARALDWSGLTAISLQIIHAFDGVVLQTLRRPLDY